MPVIEQKSDSTSLNRVTNTTIFLICQIRGQAGIKILWKRDNQVVQETSFEKITTAYPQEVISALTETQISITYKNDRHIYNTFKCTANRKNSRRFLCRSIYSCLATYPGANSSSQEGISVIVTPDIVLPDTPEEPMISNIKSRSAVVNWNAANDYLESRLEKYIIQVSNGSYTMRINVTVGIERKSQTYRLQNLAEYTYYNVSIAAESVIAISNFTEKVTLFTLYGPYIIIEEPSLKTVRKNDKNITIPCTGKSYPSPDVIWKKNGKEIQLRENSTGIANDSVYQIITQSERDDKSNMSLQVTSTLFLRPNGIKYEDHGTYTCKVWNINESNETVELTQTVEVQFLPRITTPPNDTTINEGENVELTCDAEGPPKPTFTWSNVSKKVTIEKIISKNNQVELQNVRSVGRYDFSVICIASNKGGNASANATIEILVEPRIIKWTESQTALLYDNVTLMCEILANPTAQIWWTKDGNASHHSNVQFKNDNQTLVITKAELRNFGSYSCHASNILSSTSKKLTLNLRELHAGSPYPSSSDINTSVIVGVVVAALVVIITAVLIIAWIFYRRKPGNENRQDIGNIQNASYMGDTQTERRSSQVSNSEGGYEEPSDYAQLDILKRISIDANYQSLIHKNTQGGSTNTSLTNNFNTGDGYVTVISSSQVAKESIYEELS